MNTPIFADAQIDWGSRLADPANAAGFQSLLRDIFTLPPIPESTACVAYRDALDQFVGDWFAGADVAAVWPRLWRHLQVCAQCQAAATTLSAWLAEELTRQNNGSPIRSSSLARYAPVYRADCPVWRRVQADQ